MDVLKFWGSTKPHSTGIKSTKEYSTSNTVHAVYLPQVKLNDSLYSAIHTRHHSLTYSSLMHEQARGPLLVVNNYLFQIV